MANRQQQLCYICKSLCFREQKESQAKQMSPDVATRGREVEKHTNSRYKRTVSKRSREKKCVCVQWLKHSSEMQQAVCVSPLSPKRAIEQRSHTEGLLVGCLDPEGKGGGNANELAVLAAVVV